MNKNKLFAFIQRIIETSPDDSSAQMALDQLKEILFPYLSADELALFSVAKEGSHDALSLMKSTIRGSVMTEELLKTAASRARQKRIQDEIDARHGRC